MAQSRSYRTPIEAAPSHTAISLPDLLKMGWRRKWYVLFCLALCMALGAAYYQYAPRIYQVNARLLVQKQGLPLDRAPQREDRDFLATQAEILRSPAVVAGAADVLPLPDEPAEDYSPIGMILKSLNVSPVMGTNVVSVSFRHEHPQDAVVVVESIIASYRDYLRQTERDSHLDALRLLTRSEKDLREDLAEAERVYNDLRVNSPLLGQGQGGTSVQLAMLEQLGKSLSEARNRRLELENYLQAALPSPKRYLASLEGERLVSLGKAEDQTAAAAAEASDGESLQRIEMLRPLLDPTLPDSSAILRLLPERASTGMEDPAVIRQALFQAEIREKELSQRYGHKHPEIRSVREEVTALRQRLKEALDTAPVVLKQELEAVRLQESRLADLYEDEFDKAKTVDTYLLQEQQANDRVQRVRSMHDSILTQLRELQLNDTAVADGRSGVKVTTLQQPTLARQPVWPSPALIFGACLVIGLIAGCSMIAYLELPGARATGVYEVIDEATSRNDVAPARDADRPVASPAH